MKFLLSLALVASCVLAATAAVHPGQVLAESLEKRGTALLESTRKVIYEIFASGNYHLATELEHQAVLLEAFVTDLKVQRAKADSFFDVHHIHVIEEELLHLENFISEELQRIEHSKGHHHQGHTNEQLAAKAEALVKLAKEALAKLGAHVKEAKALEHQIHQVEKLVVAIRAKPSISDLKLDEQQLAHHEKTIVDLIEKASHRNHH